MSESLSGGELSVFSFGSIVGSALTGTTNPNAKLVKFVREEVGPALFRAQAVPENQRTPNEARLVLILDNAREITGRDFRGTETLEAETRTLFAQLEGAVDFVLSPRRALEGLLEKLSGLLLKPPRVPGEPCLAPTPLLRDLLDVVLGRIAGGISATVSKVGRTVQDLLTPAAVQGDDLAHAVQAILDDPVTAALNLVLGMRDRIDCEVTARKDVGESVIEAGFKRLVGVIEEALA